MFLGFISDNHPIQFENLLAKNDRKCKISLSWNKTAKKKCKLLWVAIHIVKKIWGVKGVFLQLILIWVMEYHHYLYILIFFFILLLRFRKINFILFKTWLLIVKIYGLSTQQNGHNSVTRKARKLSVKPKDRELRKMEHLDLRVLSTHSRVFFNLCSEINI